MTSMTVKLATAPRPTATGRRLHIVPRPEPLPAPMHPAERRMRDAGGPDDRACYSCGCGFLFEAAVSTSVQCPHCESVQSW